MYSVKYWHKIFRIESTFTRVFLDRLSREFGPSLYVGHLAVREDFNASLHPQGLLHLAIPPEEDRRSVQAQEGDCWRVVGEESNRRRL